MSRHRYEAKELWLKRQEKLRNGVIDEETKSVMETCLSTKKPPEKNKKNLTYFIKDEEYESRNDFEEPSYHDSNEDLIMPNLEDVHNVKRNDGLENTTTNLDYEKPKQKVELSDKDDFIKKVNDSLKDVREFIGKIERYPSIKKGKDPEKTLKVIKGGDKENRPRASSISKPKELKQINSKNPKVHLQNSQKAIHTSQNINTEDKVKENKSEFKDGVNLDIIETSTVKVNEITSGNEDEKEDILSYFKSLNQIEDTIKFLEQNIIGVRNNQDQTNQPKPDSYMQPINIDNLLGITKSTTCLSPEKHYGEYQLNKGTDQNCLFKQECTSSKGADKSFDKEEQISFDLTMQSNDQLDEEAKSHEFSNHKYKNTVDDLFNKRNGIQSSIPNLNQEKPSSYPKVLFQNANPTENSRHSPIKQPLRREEDLDNDDDDEDDLNIERIKNLLQATKLEIEKMNTNPLEVNSSSFMNQDIEKENIPDRFRDHIGQESIIKKTVIYENQLTSSYNDVTISVKKPLNALWENQRKILEDIGNKKGHTNDDIPAPETLNIKKHYVNYSPQTTEETSLSIRSFRRK